MQPDFIEVYEDALDAGICRQLIQRFDASKLPVRGQTGGGLDLSMKDSWDICITDHAEWNDAVISLNQVVMAGLKLYLRKFSHAVLAPLQLKVPSDKSGELRVVTAEDVATMEERTLNSIIMKVFRPGTINIQKYNADRGGYPYWHCELYPKNDSAETLHRVVLWTIYLNDSFEEGETEFLYQQRKIAPRTGSLLIAPTAFTHTHRGNRPKGGDKYIATSWILFNRAEVLFGQAPKKK